ncbi:MAG: ABC transporter permease [Alphaproteobacteria bacterium]|nr:ABC transporter permease [Alphaproteobacteria bacterium]MBU1561525.1 ABC transporter permease [Alphaproteobacteria bacterium]MBU2302642.1 ABC transporter permease [Alphaproteobacteria bacterium]MBU2367716.1 ABC transporter permease [Alphaproteobacteria bacterium]
MSLFHATAIRGALATREGVLVGVNLAIFAFLSFMRPDAFASWTNLKAILSLMTYDFLLAVAMTVVLIVRGLDLSVGSVLALASVVMALLLQDGIPVVGALAIGLLVALTCGFLNGMLIAKGRILPFLVTLGMMSIARGLATVLTTGQYVSFPKAERWFTQFGRFEFRLQIGDSFYGIPLPLLIVLATVSIFAVLLSNWHVLARLFYVGQGPEAAKLSGIKVERYTIAAYVIAALFVWIAAVLMTSATRIGYANYGIGAEMRALAAAIVGGASIAGGSGSILGTFLGVLMLALIGNGFILLNGDPNWQQATFGIVLIVAVGFDAVRTYKTRR